MGIFHTLVSVSPLKIYYPSGSNGSINLFKNVVGQMIWRDCLFKNTVCMAECKQDY